jgi:hypothetical protein
MFPTRLPMGISERFVPAETATLFGLKERERSMQKMQEMQEPVALGGELFPRQAWCVWGAGGAC